VQSTAGSVILSAGDDLLLNAFANIIAAGNISIAVDAGNADPGVGGTADIRNGTLSAGSISLIGKAMRHAARSARPEENFFGGGGDDLIAGGGGSNALNGGPRSDTADYWAAPGAVSINVATGGSNGYGGNRRLRAHRERQWVLVCRHADRRRQCQHVPRQMAADDILAGAAGTDTAAYSGNAVELGIIFLPGTDMRVVDRRAGSPDGTDALSGFEALQFANGTMPVRFGTSRRRQLHCVAGLEAINAGLGNDTITFDFRLVDATVSYFGNTVTIIGPSGHTVLGGFERFVFTDGTVDNADGDVWSTICSITRAITMSGTRHADADQHFHASGWRESRDPNPFFSTVLYQSAYPDVAAAGVDPLSHFDQIGWREGRIPSLAFSPAQYRAANPMLRRPVSIRCALSRLRPAGRAHAVRAERADRRQRFRLCLVSRPQSGRGRRQRRSTVAFPDRRLARGTQSECAVRYHRLSRDLCGCGGRAGQSARPLQPVRLARGPRPVGRFRYDLAIARPIRMSRPRRSIR
jgi:hypothetical protein